MWDVVVVNYCIGFSVSTSYNLKTYYVSRSVCYACSDIESSFLNVYFDTFLQCVPTEVDVGLKTSDYPYIGSKVLALRFETGVVYRLNLCLYWMIISAQWDDSHQNNTGSFMSTGGGICVVLMLIAISWNLRLHTPVRKWSMARSDPQANMVSS